MSLFNVDNTINVDSGTPRLKANEIHKVQLKEIKAEDLKGKDSKEYKVIYLKFQNVDGSIYEQRFFCPSSTEAIVAGSFGDQPSDLTQFRYTIQHMIEAINPNLYKQILEGKKFEIKTWDEMRRFVVKAFTPGVGVDISLKLLADNKGYATIPKYPVSITKNGDLYMSTRFIANEEQSAEKPLIFTDKEKKKMVTQEKVLTSQPSSVSNIDFNKGGAVPKTDDDFDI